MTSKKNSHIEPQRLKILSKKIKPALPLFSTRSHNFILPFYKFIPDHRHVGLFLRPIPSSRCSTSQKERRNAQNDAFILVSPSLFFSPSILPVPRYILCFPCFILISHISILHNITRNIITITHTTPRAHTQCIALFSLSEKQQL